MMQSFPTFVAQSLNRNADQFKVSQRKLTVYTGAAEYAFWRDGDEGPVLGVCSSMRGRKKEDIDPKVIAAALAG